MKLSIRQRKAGDDFPFVSLEEKDLSLERARETEWLLTNGLGGYSSSTAIELNTRKYHGILVSSNDVLDRFVALQKLEEEVIDGKKIIRLSTNEFSDGTLTDGYEKLRSFNYSYNSVSFFYQSWSADIEKKISMVHGENAVIVSYHVRNKMLKDIKFKVNILVNSRSIYDLTNEGLAFELKGIDPCTLGIKSRDGYLKIHSDKAEWKETEGFERWIKNVKYQQDESRGEACTEDMHFPAYFLINVPAAETRDFFLTAVACEDREKTLAAIKRLERGYKEKGRVIGSGNASSLFALLANAESFVVDRGDKKTVVAGYHWFGEWGRDSMISLPGLTLVNNRLNNAEQILSHFLGSMNERGIPNSFSKGVPQYSDYDSALWLIDRVHQYMKYAGKERTGRLIEPHWAMMKKCVEHYMSLTEDGLLRHKSGTWMDTLERNDAVEIQALWFNALRVMEELAKLVHDTGFDASFHCMEFQKNFLPRYWNGKYLNDCLGDKSLRPNQLIAISLDHGVVDVEKAKKILGVVEKELLTPYGLRTLKRRDRRYRGRYEGGVQDREKAYHNGTVWPWLLGPYIKACIKCGGSKEEARRLLETLFQKHIREAGLGCVSEVFDGDAPHKPRGCISQAWSVAEPLRAYFEDIEGRRIRNPL